MNKVPGLFLVLKSRKFAITITGWLLMTFGIALLQKINCPSEVILSYIACIGTFVTTTLVGRIKQDMQEIK